MKHGRKEIEQFDQLARGVHPHLTEAYVIHKGRRLPTVRPREIPVEVEGVQPPAVQSATEPVLLMRFQEAAVSWLLDPPQMREELLPLSDDEAELE